MLENKFYPIDYDGQMLTVAIRNPANTALRNELIYNKAPDYQIRFVLNDNLDLMG